MIEIHTPRCVECCRPVSNLNLFCSHECAGESIARGCAPATPEDAEKSQRQLEDIALTCHAYRAWLDTPANERV